MDPKGTQGKSGSEGASPIAGGASVAAGYPALEGVGAAYRQYVTALGGIASESRAALETAYGKFARDLLHAQANTKAAEQVAELCKSYVTTVQHSVVPSPERFSTAWGAFLASCHTVFSKLDAKTPPAEVAAIAAALHAAAALAEAHAGRWQVAGFVHGDPSCVALGR